MSASPVATHERRDQLVAMTGAYCRAHVNEEYAALCEQLVQRMARKRTVPFATGRLDTWSAAVIYALGTINFLFDKATEPHVTPDDLCTYFGVTKRTVQQKASTIRALFKMHPFDPEFSTRHMQESNPFARMVMVDGFIVELDR